MRSGETISHNRSFMKNPWQTLSTRQIYENPWFRVREDQVIRPDGNPGIYGVVEFADSVGVVALNENGEIALVGQWRYTRNRNTWELPIGSSKTADGDMLRAAQRELREETGVEAESWERIGVLDCIVGATTERATLFLARDLKQGEAQPDPEEAIVVRWVPMAEAVDMVMRDEITECISVAAILRAEKLTSHPPASMG